MAPPLDEVKLEESIIQILLEIYAERTSLPVAFYQMSSKKFIWSKKGEYSPLCLMLNEHLPSKTSKICTEDHIGRCTEARGVPEICHAGLWNTALPINVNDKMVAVLISGQRRLTDEEKESTSNRNLNALIKKCKRHSNAQIKESFDSTPRINKEDFDTHLLGNLRDIQAYLYRWLIENDKDELAKRNKIHNLAHEFLLPIQAIIADAENLFNEVENTELKGISEDILQEMQKLALIAENMRGSLIAPKSQAHVFFERNLHRCIMESVTLFRKEARKKNININDPITYGNTKFPRIEMSYDHLKRAFMNLIHNAVKYSYEGGPNKERFIEIVGENCDTNFFCVSISNYGIGITKEEIESGDIFRERYRGKLSVDRNRTGSGLGLSEVDKILKNHNGRIVVQSEQKTDSEFGPYKTTFKIFLPIKQGKS